MATKEYVFFVLLTISVLIISDVESLIHEKKVRNEEDVRTYIEKDFGLLADGVIKISITDLKVEDRSIKSNESKKIGFVVVRTKTPLQTEDDSSADLCKNPLISALNTAVESHVEIYPEANKASLQNTIIIGTGEQGLYSELFVNCLGLPVSFDLLLSQYNVDDFGEKDYLSAGESILPSIFGLFALIYFASFVFWLFYLRSCHDRVNRMHHLMTVLVALKAFSIFFRTLDYHFLKTSGTATGWNVLYYIFASLKGIMLFVLIALIGTGWTFIKPFLTDKDKKVFLLVIPLQVLANIAMVIIEETAPGSEVWSRWRQIFHLLDIVCCVAIFIPILWSIRHLRQASSIDGKAALSLNKLRLFRHFYLMVVIYIYFTRIISYLVEMTAPFEWSWFGVFSFELATLIFLSTTAFKFRPSPDNPYFSLEMLPTSTEDLSDEGETNFPRGEKGDRSQEEKD